VNYQRSQKSGEDLRTPVSGRVGLLDYDGFTRSRHTYDEGMIMDDRDPTEPTADETTGGRVLEMYSDNVGVQFYTGNFLNKFPGAGGQAYDIHWGFCLESQNWPDAINHPNFPSPVLRPGETYTHTIDYRFSVED